MKLTHKTIGMFALLQCTNINLFAAPDFEISIYGNATGGITDGSHQSTAYHEHDPNNDYNLQGIEAELSMRANEYLEGFLAGNLFLDEDDQFDSEWEEGFLKFKNLALPGKSGTLEVRAGFYLNRIGTENNVHLHGWEYVNSNLSTALFLGEEGLRTQGAEVSWMKDLENGHFSISASFGKALEHEHGEEEGDDHDEEEESIERAYFNDDLVTVRAQLLRNSTDFFQHRTGVNFAQGQNGFGRDTSLFGADYTFTWRENGLERGGREISAGVEYFYRDVEWQDEVDASFIGDSGQQSLAIRTSYAWNESWKIGARYEWIEGVSGDVFSIGELQRASLALTHTKRINDDWSTKARLQLNHDKRSEGSSNNAYLQLGFSFGGSEVR